MRLLQVLRLVHELHYFAYEDVPLAVHELTKRCRPARKRLRGVEVALGGRCLSQALTSFRNVRAAQSLCGSWT